MKMKVNSADLLEALHTPATFKRLRNLKRSGTLSDAPPTDTETKLKEWLGRLKLLHGIPFNYLVPHVDMLPTESIRFFYCDIKWLDYLQEGALSIGRYTSSQKAHDSAFSDDIRYFSQRGMRDQRANEFGHLAAHLHPVAQQSLTQAPIPANEIVTGFLLRSGVVAGWEGLQVEAFYDPAQKQPATLLRMDHLSPNVLLCLFEGEIKSFRIHEYPEVLHFGVSISSSTPKSYLKGFRYIEDKGNFKAGEAISNSTAPALKLAGYERPNAPRVVRMNKLARAMQKTMENTVGYKGPFTSAEFALEMVEGVEAVNFTINY